MNTLFIWIPKTAGTSFYSVLKEELGMKLYTENYNLFNGEGSVSFGHACIGSLMNANILKPEYVKNTEMITVVRNPYDRFVSLFNDYKRTGRIPPTFTQFDFANTLRTMKRKPGLYNSIEFSMCANQTDWIVLDSVIITLEELNDFVKDMFSIDLPTLNCSKDNILDENCKDIVGELYNKDFCLLDYQRL